MPPRYISVSLTPPTRQQLEEIAQEAKMTPGRVAGLLLEEIIPNIRAIRHRLQIVKKDTK